MAVAWTRDLETTEEMNLTESMRRLADGTGGLVTMNASDPGPILSRMRDDFDSYYSLGFVPQKAKDGRTRKLAVEVRGRRDLQVRTRDSRRERPEKERMTDRALAALPLDPGQNPLEVALDFTRETKNAKGQIELEVLVKFPGGHSEGRADPRRALRPGQRGGETRQPMIAILPGPPSVGASQRLWNATGSLPGNRAGGVLPRFETARPIMVSERTVVKDWAVSTVAVPRAGRLATSPQ